MKPEHFVLQDEPNPNLHLQRPYLFERERVGPLRLIIPGETRKQAIERLEREMVLLMKKLRLFSKEHTLGTSLLLQLDYLFGEYIKARAGTGYYANLP